MTREEAKYPTPKNPGDDRGYGPSWRDVDEALIALAGATGCNYRPFVWPTDRKKHPNKTCMEWSLWSTHSRPWLTKENPGGPWGLYPTPGFKTVPALLLKLIDDELDLIAAWKARSES